MRNLYLLTIFNYDTIYKAFDNFDSLLHYIKFYCDLDDTFYIEKKWLSEEMMKTLNIDYIRG